MSDSSPARYICPNCRVHLDALAEQCRACGADFGEQATWRPIAAASQASEIEPPRLQAQPTPGKGLLVRLEEALGLSALTVVGVLLLAAVIDGYLTFGTGRFNAATWLKKPTRAEENQCYRGAMAYDVKDRLLSSSVVQH